MGGAKSRNGLQEISSTTTNQPRPSRAAKGKRRKEERRKERKKGRRKRRRRRQRRRRSSRKPWKKKNPRLRRTRIHLPDSPNLLSFWMSSSGFIPTRTSRQKRSLTSGKISTRKTSPSGFASINSRRIWE